MEALAKPLHPSPKPEPLYTWTPNPMPYALRPEILNPYKKKPPYRPISEATLAASVSKSWPTCAAFFIWLVV